VDVRGERVRAREGPFFFNIHSRFDYSWVCVEKERTFTHGNAAVSAAKSAGRRTPGKGLVMGAIPLTMGRFMIGGILVRHHLVLSVRTIEPVALSRR
jgi:hypothetical protein